MSDIEDEVTEPNLWLPMQDRVTLAALAKLAEECGELSAAIARCIAQGIDEREPVTGKPNLQWLEDEMADVMALLQVVENSGIVNLSGKRIIDKYAMKMKWLQMIRDWEAAQ
jgi:NTP pyrophosphatase (non-canonical NTP hydrolase)